MFAKFRDNLYRFVKNPRTKNYEVVSSSPKKGYSDFMEYKNGVYKEVFFNDADLLSVFSVELWLTHDTGIIGLPTDWRVSLDGWTEVNDDEISIEYDGFIKDTRNWERIDKCIWKKFIKMSDVSGAYVLFKYTKKDGVLLDEPLVVREDVSLEKLLELRGFYGGTL